jgi:hypothetical protein
MRKLITVAAGLALAGSLSACGKNGYDRDRPDEFAVARQAPLVIPPDFALVPPRPGAPRPQDTSPPARRSTHCSAARRRAARRRMPRSTPPAAPRPKPARAAPRAARPPMSSTRAATTRDIVAAPEGDGQTARASTPK